MSGHSKWSTIKHQKAVSDARRGQLFTKLTREIVIAARQGGGDPESNIRLRLAVQRARDSNMPLDNIGRAIKKATGEGADGNQLTEATYEGYGPGGTAIIVHALTDNRNRTAAAVRATFSKWGGSLAEAGTVAWQFSQRGIVVAQVSEYEADDLALLAIDAGAEDFSTEDGIMEVFAAPESLETVRQALEESHASIRSSELSMVATNTVELVVGTAKSALRLLDHLEELDDVQRVFSNGDFPDAVLDEYGG